MAKAHEADLATQGSYGVNYLRYWIDEEAGKIFCLVDTRLLADARTRCNRLADPYVWLDGYNLDAACALGLRHRHPDTGRWVEQVNNLASRSGMRELEARSLLHLHALGRAGSEDAAALIVADIDNPCLHAQMTSAEAGLTTP